MRVWTLLFFFLLTSCSENIFDEIADKDTNDALYFQAQQELNSQNYGTAITLLESIDASYLADRDRVPVYASAYSGRCGLEFFALLTSLQNTGTSTILGLLMGAMTGAVASSVTDCITAQGILTAIGDESARNANENLLLTFNSFAKVGAILSSLADTDANGTTDATFDQCNATHLPEASVRELGAGLGLALISLAAVGTGYIDDGLADVTALCAVDPNLAAFCNTTDPAAFTAAEVQALRYAIGSNDFGIDSCGGNNLTACALANPICP